MCGIVAIHSPEKPIDLQRLRRAIELLAHRGPDGQGIWIAAGDRVGLAHRRLQMVGGESGRQPLVSTDQKIAAVVNGEFYPHRELRQRLKSDGYTFRTESDSELLIPLYQRYGLDFVDHLDGEFALVIWDAAKQRLIAARDRFGIKPLLYRMDDDQITFASEAKALAAEAWDFDSIFYAASRQYLPPDQTLFQGVRQIPPGNMMVVEGTRTTLMQYWDLDFPSQGRNESDAIAPFADCVQQVRTLLTRSVLDRLDAETPICFHLSGGLDSSAVLGIASKESGNRQHAFTICFEDQRYDEFEIAQQTAKFCGAEHHVVRISDQMLIDHLLESAQATQGLAINGHLPAKYLLNKSIREAGFKAAITGEGADETFFGYAHLFNDYANQGVDRANQPAAAERANSTSLGMMVPSGLSLPTIGLERVLGYVPSFVAAKATLGHKIYTLLEDDVAQVWREREAFAQLLDADGVRDQLAGRLPVQQSNWLWTKLALAGYILRTLGDATEMASSIEGRLPFLDRRLFEFVRQLPMEYLFDGDTEKHLLREAVKPYVTPVVYRRTKHPLDSPPILTSGTAYAMNFLTDQLSSTSFRRQPFFSRQKTEHLISKIPKMNATQRQVWDPVLVMLVSTLGIQT